MDDLFDAFRREMTAGAALPPVTVEIDRLTAFQVVAQLQLAARHPANDGPSVAASVAFAKALTEKIAAPGSAIAAIAEMGWDPDNDRPAGDDGPLRPQQGGRA